MRIITDIKNISLDKKYCYYDKLWKNTCLLRCFQVFNSKNNIFIKSYYWINFLNNIENDAGIVAIDRTFEEAFKPVLKNNNIIIFEFNDMFTMCETMPKIHNHLLTNFCCNFLNNNYKKLTRFDLMEI